MKKDANSIFSRSKTHIRARVPLLRKITSSAKFKLESRGERTYEILDEFWVIHRLVRVNGRFKGNWINKCLGNNVLNLTSLSMEWLEVLFFIFRYHSSL